jgi:hypothetical protein
MTRSLKFVSSVGRKLRRTQKSEFKFNCPTWVHVANFRHVPVAVISGEFCSRRGIEVIVGILVTGIDPWACK